MPSLSKIGDLSCITSCLVLPGFLMDTLLNKRKMQTTAFMQAKIMHVYSLSGWAMQKA